MSRRSQFADDRATEVRAKKKGRKGGSSPFGSPAKPAWDAAVRTPVPVLIIIHDGINGNRNRSDLREELNGVVSLVFSKHAHDLREDLKTKILYDQMQALRFHWGLMRFTNIDPNSTPNNPDFNAPPVFFVQAAAEACDSTEFCSDYEIRIGHERGRKVELEDVKNLPWNLPVNAHACRKTHTHTHTHKHASLKDRFLCISIFLRAWRLASPPPSRTKPDKPRPTATGTGAGACASRSHPPFSLASAVFKREGSYAADRDGGPAPKRPGCSGSCGRPWNASTC
jgi:hypothetical protein